MEEIYSAIIIISLILLILSGGIVFAIVNYKDKQSKYLKEKRKMEESFSNELLHSRIEVQEITFGTLSKELHDNIGQLLGSAKMLIGITQRTIGIANEPLLLADETIGKAIIELRTLARCLDREWLEQFDLLTNLKTEVDRISTVGELKVAFVHPPKIMMKPDRQIILFRIIQEGIQNAIRHAKPSYLSIEIQRNDGDLYIEICDNGKGFKEGKVNGMGMNNMLHRSNLLGGKIEWTSSTKGTMAKVIIPVNEAEYEN